MTKENNKACKKKLPGWPDFPEDEIAAVRRVLQSGKVNYWTGEEGRLFEKEFAASIGVKYATTMMMEMVHCRV